MSAPLQQQGQYTAASAPNVAASTVSASAAGTDQSLLQLSSGVAVCPEPLCGAFFTRRMACRCGQDATMRQVWALCGHCGRRVGTVGRRGVGVVCRCRVFVCVSIGCVLVSELLSLLPDLVQPVIQ